MAYVYTTPEPVRHLRITPGALVIGDGVGLPSGNKDDSLADPQGVMGVRIPSAQWKPDDRYGRYVMLPRAE